MLVTKKLRRKNYSITYYVRYPAPKGATFPKNNKIFLFITFFLFDMHAYIWLVTLE